MCSHSYGVTTQLPANQTRLSFSYLSSTRPEYPPRTVSFRTRQGPCAIKSSFNDTVSVLNDVSTMSFYELLGIPDSGSFLEIKQAYKQLARKYHPDVSPPDRIQEHTQTFIRVQEAYETLSDPKRRELYDRDLLKGFHRNECTKFDETEKKMEWKGRWESQLSGLKRRSMYKESSDASMSWGARLRRERNESRLMTY